MNVKVFEYFRESLELMQSCTDFTERGNFVRTIEGVKYLFQLQYKLYNKSQEVLDFTLYYYDEYDDRHEMFVAIFKNKDSTFTLKERILFSPSDDSDIYALVPSAKSTITLKSTEKYFNMDYPIKEEQYFQYSTIMNLAPEEEFEFFWDAQDIIKEPYAGVILAFSQDYNFDEHFTSDRKDIFNDIIKELVQYVLDNTLDAAWNQSVIYAPYIPVLNFKNIP